jgi:hypothetical protein
MWLKISIFVVVVNLASIFAQDATIGCSYVNRGDIYPYTCQLSINNPEGRDDFEEIPGDHVGGEFDF